MSERLENPGQVKSDKSLRLHTKEALKIFKGRKPDATEGIREIPGLPIYASLLRDIWQSTIAGDLYGRWWIQKLETALKQSNEDLELLHGQIQKKLAAFGDRLNLTASEATEPVEVEIRYASPYMYKIIYLLIQIDQIVADMITLRHMAIITPKEFDSYRKQIVGSMHRTLMTLRQFKSYGVRSEDVKNQTETYLKAKKEMGELPEDVADGSYVPEHMPTNLKVFGFHQSTPAKAMSEQKEADDANS